MVSFVWGFRHCLEDGDDAVSLPSRVHRRAQVELTIDVHAGASASISKRFIAPFPCLVDLCFGWRLRSFGRTGHRVDFCVGFCVGVGVGVGVNDVCERGCLESFALDEIVGDAVTFTAGQSNTLGRPLRSFGLEFDEVVVTVATVVWTGCTAH